MEIVNGRPNITADDHPVTILKALRASYSVWPEEHTPEESHYWSKQAADATGALQDGFGIIDEDRAPLMPDGNATLYMAADNLEYAVAGYGLELLKSREVSVDEIAEVNAVLNAIDKALKRKS
jgi:hypothetical protein